MRANKIYKFITGAFFACMLAVGFSSCQDFDFPVDESYSRMFRPGGIATDSITATTTVVKWDAMPGVDHYVVQISRDSLLFDPIIDSVVVASKYNGIKLLNLYGNTRHSVRVKSVSATGTPDSKWVSISFKTKAEQIFNALTADDIAFTSVSLSWIPNSKVTHIILTPQGSETLQPVKITPTDAEKAEGKIKITGLTMGVTYVADIYNTDANKRGSLTFRTNEMQAIGQVIEVQPGDSIHLKLAEATSNSVTLIFKQGTYYQNNTAITLRDGLSVLFYGMPGSNPPALSFNAINLSATHGTIRFENVNLTGQYKSTDGTLASGQRDYLFNQGTITTVNNLEFKNCSFHHFNRNLVRLKDAGDQKTINNLRIDGCIVYEQGSGSYPFIGNTIANGLINNISISNSTFYRILNNFIQHSASNLTSIVISNCTFNNVVGAGKYLIDCTTGFGPTGEFTVSNCIFGKSFDATAKGIRSNKVASVTNSYKTTDWVTGGNAVPSLTDFSGASTDLFTDPANGNFMIKVSSFAGAKNAGDPRWRITE